MKNIKNKYLIAEIWETQAILYFILAVLVPNYWIKMMVVIYGIFTIIMALILKMYERKEWKK